LRLPNARRASRVPHLQALEVVPQRELHPARHTQKTIGHSEGSAAEQDLLIIRDVEAIGVCDVVNLPSELQVAIVAETPGLGQPGVQVKNAFAAEVIALTILASIGEPDGSTGAEPLVDGICVVEELGVA